MKQGWTYKKLGEVCDFQGGSQPPKKEWSSTSKPDYVRMLQIRDFTQSSTNYIEYVKKSKSLKFCDEDDVLIGRYGASVGKILTGLKGAYNVAIIKSIPDEKYLIKEFLKFYFTSSSFQHNLSIVSKNRAAQDGFSKDDIFDFIIPTPSIDIQHQIVAELDLLCGVIEKQKAQIEELDKLSQSIFYDMFGDPVTNDKGWVVSKYGEKFKISSGGTPSKTNPEYWDNGNIPWIGSNMCQNCVIYDNDGKYITEKGLNSSSTNILKVGTVLIALVGATIGKVALLQKEMATNQNIANINVWDSKDFNSMFIFFHSMNLYHLFMNLGDGGFKMANQGFIRELPLICPPLSLQQEFAAKIEAIEAMKAKVRQSLKESETLFNSRMDYYFN